MDDRFLSSASRSDKVTLPDISCALHGPIIFHFEEDRADGASDGAFAWEGADDLPPALALTAAAFDGVRAVELAAIVLRGEFV